MDKRLAAVLLATTIIAVALISASARSDAGVNNTKASADQPAATTEAGEDITLPACLSDYDCANELYNYAVTCWKDYVVEDSWTIKCVDPGKPNATCVKDTRREFIDWCRHDETCIEGKIVCQPAETCSDGIQDQGETGIDCGGPCETCPSCGNGIRDGSETGVDCGGICPSCEVYCTSDESCGMPHWSEGYCRNKSVYQDYVTYECIKPGQYGSWCRIRRDIILLDYCGPKNPCVDGECSNPKAPKWKSLEDGDAETDGKVVTIGTWYGLQEVKVH